ncbi:radical SAM protein, partial [Candidatus Desantisbacteria bacterium]|nr:radical SAM protein [Candidatus Desantisbacteria bacterium]
MYKIKSFIESSFIDWDGKISSVIFLPGCNLRCIYCHNHKLVISPDELPTLSWDKIYNYLISHKNWIDGVCITGGEPCIHEDLEILLKKIKNENFAIKLDTN